MVEQQEQDVVLRAQAEQGGPYREVLLKVNCSGGGSAHAFGQLLRRDVFALERQAHPPIVSR
jgi:hypothetical protein